MFISGYKNIEDLKKPYLAIYNFFVGNSAALDLQKRTQSFSELSNALFGPAFIHPQTKIEWPHFYTSPFGTRKITALKDKTEAMHYGIDLVPRDPQTNLAVTISGKRANKNFPIKCIGDGKVVELGFKRGMGNYVLIEHNNGLHTLYAHLQNRRLPPKGSLIKKGEVLGYLGNSGKRTTGAHLHFELRTSAEQGSAIDPLTEEGTKHIASLITPTNNIAYNDNFFRNFLARYTFN